MKLHVDTEAKTVVIEGEVQVSTVFNYLMSWFPEAWEKWKFTTELDTPMYNEIIITNREIARNPYWNPWEVNYYASIGNDTNEPFANPYFTADTKSTLNFNQLNQL